MEAEDLLGQCLVHGQCEATGSGARIAKAQQIVVRRHVRLLRVVAAEGLLQIEDEIHLSLTIPVKHAARIRINFHLRLKGVDGWDPNSKTLFYAGFVFRPTTSVNIGCVRTGYDATGIVGAGRKVAAVGGYAFSGSAALTGYRVWLFANACDASCSIDTKLVAQDTVDTNSFYYVSRTGTDQHSASAPSLPAGVKYAVQLCNGLTPLAVQTLDSRLGDKEFEEIDFDVSY